MNVRQILVWLLVVACGPLLYADKKITIHNTGEKPVQGKVLHEGSFNRIVCLTGDDLGGGRIEWPATSTSTWSAPSLFTTRR